MYRRTNTFVVVGSRDADYVGCINDKKMSYFVEKCQIETCSVLDCGAEYVVYCKTICVM